MHRTRILAAALLSSSLFACGGSDSDDAPAPQRDLRKNVLGTYNVTGTLTLTIGSDSSSSQVTDTLRISPNAVTSRVNLLIESLGCGPVAWMRNENSFSINTTECALPKEESCTSTMVYKQGSGERASSSSSLQVSINAELVMNCGGRTAKADVVMEMTGNSNGTQQVPIVQQLEAREHLHEALTRLAHAANQ